MGRIDPQTSDQEPLILFAGDLYLGEEVAEIGTPYNLEKPIADFIASHDLFGVNIEAPICVSGHRQEKYSVLKMDPERVIPAIKRIGVKIAFLANNHIMDYGDRCLSETISHLSRAGVRFTGAGSNIDEALKPLEISIDGVRIAMVNFTTVFTLQSLASIDRAGVAGLRLNTEIHINPYEVFEEPGAPYIVDAEPVKEDLERIADLIEKTSRSSDLTIIYTHWGVGALPYSRIVLNYMRRLTSKLIDRGASIVVGSHPHVLLHPEKIHGGLVIYSLGNFIFTHKPKGLSFSNVGGMLSIRYLRRTKEYAAALLPLCLDEKGFPRICRDSYNSIPEIVEFINLGRAGGIGVSLARWNGLDLIQISL